MELEISGWRILHVVSRQKDFKKNKENSSITDLYSIIKK